MRVVVVDYGLGNLHSLKSALGHLKIKHEVDDNGQLLPEADCIVLPGVAAFGAAVANLIARNQFGAIQEAHTRGARLVGLCLGAQLFVDSSEESIGIPGLGLVEGRAVRIGLQLEGGPHQGWSRLQVPDFAHAKPDRGLISRCFFFSHSYHVELADPSAVLAQVQRGSFQVTAAYSLGNAIGLQFHPERSGDAGLAVLEAAVAGRLNPVPHPEADHGLTATE